MLKAGDTVGKFKILGQLGSGGMADVYEAEDSGLGRRVALKILPPELTRNAQLIIRFEREVRAAASLNHHGIVTVFEVGEHEGLHYYSMRLLTGGDLRDRIDAGVKEVEALAILRELADAFQHAHSRGFVHRDVKPENIIFDEQGYPVLTDFGIAKAIDSGTRVTATGVSVGTPRYISPEQARGRTVDARADLYSLGVILYEMLTGEPPYDAEESLAVIFKHVTEPIPKLPEATAHLQPLVDALMAKEPEERPKSADALIRLIDQYVPAHRTQAFRGTPGETQANPLVDRMITPSPLRSSGAEDKQAAAPPPSPAAPAKDEKAEQRAQEAREREEAQKAEAEKRAEEAREREEAEKAEKAEAEKRRNEEARREQAEKQRQAEKERQEDEERARVEKQRQEESARIMAEKQRKEAEERARVEKQKQEEAERIRAEKQRVLEAERAAAEKQRKEEAERARIEKQRRDEEERARAEKQRQDDAARAEAERKRREAEALAKAEAKRKAAEEAKRVKEEAARRKAQLAAEKRAERERKRAQEQQRKREAKEQRAQEQQRLRAASGGASTGVLASQRNRVLAGSAAAALVLIVAFVWLRPGTEPEIDPVPDPVTMPEVETLPEAPAVPVELEVAPQPPDPVETVVEPVPDTPVVPDIDQAERDRLEAERAAQEAAERQEAERAAREAAERRAAQQRAERERRAAAEEAARREREQALQRELEAERRAERERALQAQREEDARRAAEETAQPAEPEVEETRPGQRDRIRRIPGF